MELLGQTKTYAEQLADAAVAANVNAYYAVKQAQEAGRQLVWGNVDGTGQGPTPEEAVALLGVNAGKWFRASALSAMIITTIDGVEPQIMPEGWTYTAHDDGTVTLHRPE